MCGPARPSGRRLALGSLIPLSLFFALPHSLRPWFHPPESKLLPLPRPFPLSCLRITLTHPHTILDALKEAFKRSWTYTCVELCAWVWMCIRVVYLLYTCAVPPGVALRAKRYSRAVTETLELHTGPIVHGSPSTFLHLLLLFLMLLQPLYLSFTIALVYRFRRISDEWTSRFESICPCRLAIRLDINKAPVFALYRMS